MPAVPPPRSARILSLPGRAFGALPYPMPFVRTAELVGFQRWVIGAYDKRVDWPAWEAAKYRPQCLGDVRQGELV